MISKKAKTVLFDLASQIAGKKLEHQYIVDAKTGEVLEHSKGQHNNVHMSKQAHRAVKLDGKKYVVLHNHPKSKGPSLQDVVNALHLNYNQGWVVTKSGKIWTYEGKENKRYKGKELNPLWDFRALARARVMGWYKERLDQGGKKIKPNKLKAYIIEEWMELLKKGVTLKPLVNYKIVRANPSDPCAHCGRYTKH